MQPRFRGSDRNAQRARDLRERQVQVVVEGDDDALIHVESAEGPLDLVALDHRGGAVRHGWVIDGSELDLDRSSPGAPELVVTGSYEEAVQPGVESVRVAQPGQVPPGANEGLLDGVSRSLGIPEDEPGGGVQAIDRGACEHGKGVMIALLRPFHEVTLHVVHRLGPRPGWPRLPSMAAG